MENTKQQTLTEKFYIQKSMFEKILFIIGGVCFIVACVFVIVYSGFTSEPQHEVKVVVIPDLETLWIVNALLGIIGGGLINYKKFLAAVPAGFAASLFMTDFTLFYISFRSSIISYEILIPLFLGSLVGVFVYKLFYRFIYKKKDDEILKSKIEMRN